MNQDEEATDSFQRQSLDNSTTRTTKKSRVERKKTLIRESNIFETEKAIESFCERQLT